MITEVAYRRTLDEIVTLYSLETELRDIYVEGPSDKGLLSWFSTVEMKSKLDIYEIDDVFIPAEMLLSRGLEDNRRDRVVLLVETLNSNSCNPVYVGVIDRDVLPFTRGLPEVANLLVTDFSSAEIYFHDPRLLAKVFLLGFSKFGIDVARFISELDDPLRSVFELRVAEKRMELSISKTPFTRYVEIENNRVFFDFQKYLENTLVQNSLTGKKAALSQTLSRVKLDLESVDIRLKIHGHDFIELLHHFLKKAKIIKATTDIESVTALIRCAIERDNLLQYTLFKKLHEFA